jgi:phosphoribulokinase
MNSFPFLRKNIKIHSKSFTRYQRKNINYIIKNHSCKKCDINFIRHTANDHKQAFVIIYTYKKKCHLKRDKMLNILMPGALVKNTSPTFTDHLTCATTRLHIIR